MKKLSALSLLAAGALALAGCSTPTTSDHATAAASAEHPARIQVSVSLPPSMRPLRDDDIEEAFAYRVSSALHEQGFRGHIAILNSGDRAQAGVPTLHVSVMEWRTSPVGNVDCSFTARLETAGGNKDLGLFSGSSMMMWPRRDVFARAQGFEDAASSALSDLAKRVEETGLVAK